MTFKQKPNGRVGISQAKRWRVCSDGRNSESPKLVIVQMNLGGRSRD